MNLQNVNLYKQSITSALPAYIKGNKNTWDSSTRFMKQMGDNTTADKEGFKGIMLAVIFIWAGLLLGISFLEAPLKFQAPNVTLGIGLGIGRLVFGTLNKIEIAFAIVVAALCWKIKPTVLLQMLFSGVVIVLVVQSVWLLPVLDARAEAIISGDMPTQQSPHLYYVAGEIIKLLLLVVSGFKLFTWSLNKPLSVDRYGRN